jgi:hypothetical protein
MRRYTSVAAAVSHTLAASWWVWKWISLFGAGSIIASFFVSNTTAWIVVFVVSTQICTVCASLTVFFWLRNAQRRADAVNPHLEITRFVSTYYVRSNDEYELVQELSIRAKSLAIDRYLAKFRWTGGGTISVSVEPTSFEVVKRERDAEGFFEVQGIKFDRKLRRGETRSFTVRIHLHDDARIAHPFVAKVVDDDYPNGFSQRVCLPKVPRRYALQVFRNSHSQIPLEDDINESPDSTEIMQKIRYPLFARRYVLRWNLDDGN